MKYYLGIDIGTSSAKLTLINDKKDVVLNSEHEYSYSQPKSGWKEISPDKWVSSVETGLKHILNQIDKEQVQAIGISGQMHTTIFLDEFGESIRPAIMWNDTRTNNYFPQIKENLTAEDTKEIYKIISTGCPAINLLWLKDNEYDNFARMKKFLVGPDYLTYYFTGNYSTDFCHASTSSLYDTKNMCWSPTMKKLVGLSNNVYPEIKGSGEFAGVIRSEIAEKFGLSPNVKVIVGTGDNPAAAISTGSLQKGVPLLSIGTSGVLITPYKNDGKSFHGKGKKFLFSYDGKNIIHLIQGAVQAAGGSHKWFVQNILDSADFDSLTANVDMNELGDNDLLFYPHLTGDKTIYSDTSLRGAFLGLAMKDSRTDMVVAVMEGVCFAVKQLIEEMKVDIEDKDYLMVTGGGAKSNIWMQIMSHVLNLPVAQLGDEEGVSFAAAMMALGAIRKDLTLESIMTDENRIVPVKHFYPEKKNVYLYKNKYEKYLKIYGAIKEIYYEKI